VASLETQWKQQSALFSKLESSAGLLEEKIEEARAKRNALAARAQTASANRRVQVILGGISTGGAVAKFEEVRGRVVLAGDPGMGFEWELFRSRSKARGIHCRHCGELSLWQRSNDFGRRWACWMRDL
jgi:hypothetical protein